MINHHRSPGGPAEGFLADDQLQEILAREGSPNVIHVSISDVEGSVTDSDQDCLFRPRIPCALTIVTEPVHPQEGEADEILAQFLREVFTGEEALDSTACFGEFHIEFFEMEDDLIFLDGDPYPKKVSEGVDLGEGRVFVRGSELSDAVSAPKGDISPQKAYRKITFRIFVRRNGEVVPKSFPRYFHVGWLVSQ